jgi:hypothetical protein
MLIKSNTELRKHLGGAVSTSLGVPGDTVDENDRILNYVPVAETKYIKKAIGSGVYGLLNNAYNGSGVGNTLLEIFDAVQKATAFYAYYEYLSFASADDGNNGLQADEKKSPKMWMVAERQNKAAELASDMIEEALRLLFASELDEFKTSDVWLNTYGLLVNSGNILKVALPPSGGSYRFFLTLWPYMVAVEEFELVSVAGAGTYARFLEKRNGTSQTGVSAEFLKARKKAEALVAYAAYAEAIPQGLVVTVTNDGGLRVLSEFDGIRNRNKPTADQLAILLKSVTDKRDRLREELKVFLTANLEEFTEFETEKYVAGEKPAFMDNEQYKTIFAIR